MFPCILEGANAYDMIGVSLMGTESKVGIIMEESETLMRLVF
jgi:hypothetical protein